MEEKTKSNQISVEQMKELIQSVSDSNVTSFLYEEGDMMIHIKKDVNKLKAAPVVTTAVMQPVQSVTPVQEMTNVQNIQPQAASVQNVVTEASEIVSGNTVKSPLVGTFYTSSSPEADAFVKVGDHVTKGQVLGIIEAMKLMNEIESEFDGEIVEILVNNKDMVEYDQPLFRIK